MNIEADLIQYIGKELAQGRADIQPDTTLQDVIDSTAVMELVVWIEDKFGFGVELDDIEPNNFGSVRKLAAYIAQRKKR